MPTTRSGRCSLAANSVTPMDDVFVARIAVFGQQFLQGFEERALGLQLFDDGLDGQQCRSRVLDLVDGMKSLESGLRIVRIAR